MHKRLRIWIYDWLPKKHHQSCYLRIPTSSSQEFVSPSQWHVYLPNRRWMEGGVRGVILKQTAIRCQTPRAWVGTACDTIAMTTFHGSSGKPECPSVSQCVGWSGSARAGSVGIRASCVIWRASVASITQARTQAFNSACLRPRICPQSTRSS